jgi:hypothetical protein
MAEGADGLRNQRTGTQERELVMPGWNREFSAGEIAAAFEKPSNAATVDSTVIRELRLPADVARAMRPESRGDPIVLPDPTLFFPEVISS